jgi:hypothetical protein
MAALPAKTEIRTGQMVASFGLHDLASPQRSKPPIDYAA